MHPASDRNLELILPAPRADWMSLAPAEFVRWAAAAGEKFLVVLVDNNAGWHVAKRLGMPPNVALRRLPALQPAEPLGRRKGDEGRAALKAAYDRLVTIGKRAGAQGRRVLEACEGMAMTRVPGGWPSGSRGSCRC